MQEIQGCFYKFMACIQRLKLYISERLAMRCLYIVGLAISRAKYYCLNLSVNYNSLSLTNREALAVLCSVIKHAGSGYSTKADFSMIILGQTPP